MKTKTIFLAITLLAAGIAHAQITPSITVPNPLPNFDGSYDDFGTNHLFYPNGNEVRFANEGHGNAIEVVKYYTMNTNPKEFLLANNNISLGYLKPASTPTGLDSLQRIDLEWQGSNTSAFLARVDTQNFAQLNYFTQWFSSSGRTNVQGGAAIACQSIYTNIDLVYTSNNAGLVMYFIVYPGGNYNDIVLHLNGSTANSIVSNKLKIESNWDETEFQKPQMYQYTISGGVITPVNVCNAYWTNTGTDTYQISNTSTYNTSLPLIIQLKQANPVAVHTAGMKWSTYFGGGQFDFLSKTHCDASDNLYVAGYTGSFDFPQAQGATGNPYKVGDGIIAKFNVKGVIQWSTFVGGSSNDEIHDFDFNNGSIYCVGRTSSSDLVPTPKAGASPNDGTLGAAGWDGFIFEFAFSSGINPSIQKNWLTYYGGNGDDELNGVKFDAAGSMFVVGASASTDLSAFGPFGSYQQSFNSTQLSQLGTPAGIAISDAIIAKFDASTSNNSWFTFYGTDALGTNANSYSGDFFYGLAIDGTDLYACGKAGGTGLPNSINSKLVNGNFDGILAHFTTGGAMAAGDAKYTDGNIANYSVKTLSGDVLTVGEADNTMSPTNSGNYYYNGTASGTSDGCFSVHSSNLATTIHNTFLGGSGSDAAYDIQIMPNSQVLISGGTNSSDFPTYNLAGPYYSSGNPFGATWPTDNFVSCLAAGNTNLLWSTYLGSQYQESLSYPDNMNTGNWPAVTTMAVTSANGLYVLGVTNSLNTFPPDEWYGFPTYFQSKKAGTNAPGGTNDGTLTRIDMTALGETTGIKDFPNTEFVFGFYPNPTSKTLSITNKALMNEELHYAVYDLSGRKLQEDKLKAEDVKEINVSTLPQGIYVINVSNGKVTYSNKFVKADN